MECPKCKEDLACPCKHCKERETKDAKLHYKWLPDGETIQCPVCGYTAHCDWWD